MADAATPTLPPRSFRRAGSGRGGVFALLAGVMTLTASTASAALATASETVTADEIHPVITNRATGEFMRALGRTSAEVAVAEIALVDYRDAMQVLAEDHAARLDAAGGGGTGGRGGLEDFLARQIAVLEVGRETWHQAAGSLSELTLNLEIFYDGDPTVMPLVNELERNAYRRSLSSAGGQNFEAGESVDLAALVTLARAAELAGPSADEAAIERAVGAWTAANQAVLKEATSEAWLGRIDRRIAGASGDPADLAAAEERICRAWELLAAPLERARADIAAAAGDDAAADAWTRRVRRACHPWLVGRDARRIELATGWMQRNAPGLEAEVRDIVDEWARTRDADEADAARLVEDARRNLARIVTPMTSIMDLGGPQLTARHSELLRNSGRLKETDDAAYARIRSLLPPERRGRFDRDVGAAASRR